MTPITRQVLKEWAQAALIRALKTWAQTGVAYLSSATIGVLEADWVGFMSVTIMAFVLSWLTSIAGLPEVENGKDLSLLINGDNDAS